MATMVCFLLVFSIKIRSGLQKSWKIIMEKDVHPVSDHKINVENNVILTTKDEITVQQVFNYLTKNTPKG